MFIREAIDPQEVAWKTVVVLESPAAAVARRCRQHPSSPPLSLLQSWLSEARAAHDAWQLAPDDTLLIDADALNSAATAERLEAGVPGAFGEMPAAGADAAGDLATTLAAQALCAAHPEVRAVLRLLSEAGLAFGADSPPTPPRSAAQSPMSPTLPADGLTTGHAAIGEVALLRACLADAQQELEDLYLQMRDLRSRASGGAAAGRRSLRTGHLRWTDVGPTAAAVDLRPLEVVGERSWPSVQAELHLVGGQPALRILATGSDPEVVSAWRTDGTSDGRAYAEFRPYDAAGRQRLEHLGAADWDVVSGLTTLLARDATTLGDELPAALRLAAVRLQRQLSEMPHRFRYDNLTVTEESAEGGGLALRFGNASFGATDLGHVVLDWSPARLLWRRQHDAPNLPLAHWPFDAEGRPADTWEVPVAKGQGARAQNHAAMTVLSAHDQALVLGVLDALPAAAALTSERFAAAHGGREALTRALAAELRAAARLQHQGRMRKLLVRAAAAAAGLRRR